MKMGGVWSVWLVVLSHMWAAGVIAVPAGTSSYVPTNAFVCARLTGRSEDQSQFLRRYVDSYRICRCQSRLEALCGEPVTSDLLTNTNGNQATRVLGEHCIQRKKNGDICRRGREKDEARTPYCDCGDRSAPHETQVTFPAREVTQFVREPEFVTEVSTTTEQVVFGTELVSTSFFNQPSTQQETFSTTTDKPVVFETETDGTSFFNQPSTPSQTPTTATIFTDRVTSFETATPSHFTDPSVPPQPIPSVPEDLVTATICCAMNTPKVPFRTFRRTFSASRTFCRCQNKRLAVCESERFYPTARPGSSSAVLASFSRPNSAAAQLAQEQGNLALLQFQCLSGQSQGKLCALEKRGRQSSCDCAEDVPVNVADVPPELLPTIREQIRTTRSTTTRRTTPNPQNPQKTTTEEPTTEQLIAEEPDIENMNTLVDHGNSQISA